MSFTQCNVPSYRDLINGNMYPPFFYYKDNKHQSILIYVCICIINSIIVINKIKIKIKKRIKRQVKTSLFKQWYLTSLVNFQLIQNQKQFDT